jgi:hypothetical protein
MFISILVLAMFFAAGVSKVFDFSSTVKGFMGKTGLAEQLAQLAIILAILIEISAPLIVWLEQYNKRVVYSKYALISLILFTLVATVIYHKGDVSGILKNLTIVGGLTLLMSPKCIF